jgi:hypothetical protein
VFSDQPNAPELGRIWQLLGSDEAERCGGSHMLGLKAGKVGLHGEAAWPRIEKYRDKF